MLNIPRALSVCTASAALLLAAACGTGAQPATTQPGQLNVVTAFYPFQFIAERVAGQQAAVTSLTQPGAEPHDLELTPAQVGSITNADLVIYERGFQPAVDEAVAQNGGDQVLDTASVVPLQTLAEEGHTDQVEAGADGESGHDHDHGEEGLDPHVWLDPTNMITITKAVATRMAAAKPEAATTFEANAATLTAELEKLDGAYRSGLQNCARTEFITTHTAFGYLAKRYDLTQIGISGLSPDAEPSPARIVEVQQEAKAHAITTIFYETLVSPAVAQSIAGDLGLKTDVLDPVEGITDQSRGQDYVAVMTANLDALRTANGCR